MVIQTTHYRFAGRNARWCIFFLSFELLYDVCAPACVHVCGGKRSFISRGKRFSIHEALGVGKQQCYIQCGYNLPNNLLLYFVHGALGPAAMVQYIALWRQVRHIDLSDEPDKLKWRWTPSATYSASSCYKSIFIGACEDPHWKLTWRPCAPLRVKFFLWLVMHDRCWTAERLARHSLPHDATCALCGQEPENMHHLLAGCSFSGQTWHKILSWVRATVDIPSPDTPFHTWWTTSCNQTTASMRKGLSSLIILTAWWLWKHCNGCVFDGDRPSITLISDTIKDEVRLWAKAGANGLQNILPDA